MGGELRAFFHRPRSARDWARLAAWAYLIFGLTAPAIRELIGYDSIAFVITLPLALAALLWVAPRRYEIRTWTFYIVAIVFFTQLRDAADETSIKSHTGYVLDWELWMFGGTTPSSWLQDAVGGSDGNPNAIGFFSTFTHWTWFAFPHAVVLATFFIARDMFFRVAVIIAGTFFFAVALYYLVPTVPPWLAAEEGVTTGIRRIMEDVGPQVLGEKVWNDMFGLFADPNPRAAMPSLHFAASFVVLAVAILVRSWPLFVIAALYSTALAFSLMYLGEHYFADILAGGVSAMTAYFICNTALGHGPGGLGGTWLKQLLRCGLEHLPTRPSLRWGFLKPQRAQRREPT